MRERKHVGGRNKGNSRVNTYIVNIQIKTLKIHGNSNVPGPLLRTLQIK